MSELYCYKCQVKSVSNCGYCRYIYKDTLVDELRKLKKERVYLTEGNRNKNGAPIKLTEKEVKDIRTAYKADPKKNSYSKLAYRYNVSKGTISNIINLKIDRKTL